MRDTPRAEARFPRPSVAGALSGREGEEAVFLGFPRAGGDTGRASEGEAAGARPLLRSGDGDGAGSAPFFPFFPEPAEDEGDATADAGGGDGDRAAGGGGDGDEFRILLAAGGLRRRSGRSGSGSGSGGSSKLNCIRNAAAAKMFIFANGSSRAGEAC